MASRPLRAIRSLPTDPGVYRFRDGQGRVLYVGRAADLRARVASYWSPLGDRRHLVAMIEAIDRIEAVRCATRPEAAWLERNLLEDELPPWNRTRGGQEAVLYVRLDGRERSAGLSVAHAPERSTEGVRWFGPYLGGVQVRRAVAALARVFPVAYSARRPGGTHRAFAARLGVDAADRGQLVAAIAAVLDRDPDAVAGVHAALEREREQAAERRSYERAARAHKAYDALDWITGLQRVACLEPVDADICGWADGMLVRFGMRAGRLRHWAQERMDRADAQPLLDGTPADWRAFAQQNAELAARLAAHAPAANR